LVLGGHIVVLQLIHGLASDIVRHGVAGLKLLIGMELHLLICLIVLRRLLGLSTLTPNGTAIDLLLGDAKKVVLDHDIALSIVRAIL
jgi:hypothetical protein